MSSSALFLALLLCCVTAPVSAQDAPRGWLERMGYALEYLNYEGTLVQLQGGEPALMRIVHRVENGVPAERITAMDDVGREIIRRGEEVTCILPDQRVVLVERRGDDPAKANPLRQQFSGDGRIDDRHYRFTIASGGRLIGRPTRLVTVRPTDAYRYGYRLWLDHATAIPLKVQISDDNGAIVEQILFSDIELPDQIPESAVAPSLAIDGYTWHRSSSDVSRGGRIASAKPAWQASALPAGFELRAVRFQRTEPGAPGLTAESPRGSAADEPAVTRAGDVRSGTMEQLVYSDGVASVSVFIENGLAPGLGGPSRLGAAHGFSTTNSGRLITAVGEVPLRTVEMIARSMRPVADGSRAAR